MEAEKPLPNLRFVPLNSATWPQFEALFGEKGACGGCWCMHWRLPAAQFNSQKGAQNRLAMQALATGNEPAGVLALDNGRAVGWCAIAPRKNLLRFASSRILKPPDEKEVWSVHCFFIARQKRRQGIGVPLLEAACGYAFENGAQTIEGYPYDTAGKNMPDVFAWTGLLPVFLQVGFAEVARRSPQRPIMRLHFTEFDRH